MITWQAVVALMLFAFGVGIAVNRRRTARKVVWSEPIKPIKSPDVLALLQAGQKIDAIKLYRQLHGTDLKDSKDAVEALARQLASGR